MTNAVSNPPPRSAPNLLATIVATLGPASESADVIRRLIEGGGGVFRLNFSHADFAANERRLNTVRAVAAEMEHTVACLGTLPDPKSCVGLGPNRVSGP